MMNMHSMYDNMHKNKIFYTLIYINNHVITSINCMLSVPQQVAVTRCHIAADVNDALKS